MKRKTSGGWRKRDDAVVRACPHASVYARLKTEDAGETSVLSVAMLWDLAIYWCAFSDSPEILEPELEAQANVSLQRAQCLSDGTSCR